MNRDMRMGRPSGYDALAAGAIWQNKVVEAYRDSGVEVLVGWGHDQPDIVIPLPGPIPPVIIAVKSFTLVPSNQRRGADGRLSNASSRTVTRADVSAEVNYALLSKAARLILTIVNQRNGVCEHADLDYETFAYYSTSQRLNDDESGDREYAIWDPSDVVTLETNRQQGWARIQNPKFNQKGEQIN